MTYRGHLVGGFLAAAAVARVVPGQAPAVAILLGGLLCLVGALAPDLDSPGSYLGRAIFPLPLLWWWAASNPVTWLLVGMVATRSLHVARAVSAGHRLVGAWVAHRGFSHSLLGWGLAALLCAGGIALVARVVGLPFFLARPYVLLGAGGFAIGYASHIVLDLCTVSGVAILLPWSGRRYHLLPAGLRWHTPGW